jgi:hypothetical protein
LVEPEMNHSSSSTTPRQKTRLVVSSGKDVRRSKRICAPNREIVPVPARQQELWRGEDVSADEREGSADSAT